MKTRRAQASVFVLSVLLAFLAGCTPPMKPRNAVLTFDGETCNYDGPNVITQGQLTIVLNNKTDLDVDLWVAKLNEGRTWQDMLDYIGLPGSNVHRPPWSSSSISMTTVANNPDATVLTLSEGLYAICCCTCWETSGPQGVWPGASLEVKDH